MHARKRTDWCRCISTNPNSALPLGSARVIVHSSALLGCRARPGASPAVAPAAAPLNVRLYEAMREESLGTRQVGDVIVAASDGLFDNVFTDELVSVVNAAMRESGGNGAFQANVAAAAALSELAFVNSCNDMYDSPYAQESTKEQQRMMEAQKEKVRAATCLRMIR